MKALVLIFILMSSSQALASKVGDYIVMKNVYIEPSATPAEKTEIIKKTIVAIDTVANEYQLQVEMTMSTGETASNEEYVKAAKPEETPEAKCAIAALFGGQMVPYTVGNTTLQTCHVSFPDKKFEMYMLGTFPEWAEMHIVETNEQGETKETHSKLIEYQITP